MKRSSQVNLLSIFQSDLVSSLRHLVIQETGQKTAVKVVSKKKLSDEDYASLLMEIEILSQLDHPHIIRYVYCCCESSAFIQAMDTSEIHG